MNRIYCWAGLAALALAPPLTSAQGDERRTMMLDAVELLAGREVTGKSELSVQHDAYTYRFASSENKAAFERNRPKYEIQLGGACGSMGLLSGEGSCDIHAVYDGKLYIFASPQCRTTFLKNPTVRLEGDEPVPASDDASQRRGRELIELAVQHAGGAERVDGIRAFRQRVERTEKSGDKDARVTSTFTAVFPERFRRDETWDEYAWGFVASGDEAYFTGADGARPMAPVQRRAFQRAINRNLLVILRARHDAGFVPAATGRSSIGQTPVENVTVAFGGTVTTLGIDATDGRVLSMTYRGRGRQMGVIVTRFTEFRTIDGITLPSSWTAEFEGEPAAELSATSASIDINPSLEPALFAPVASKVAPR